MKPWKVVALIILALLVYWYWKRRRAAINGAVTEVVEADPPATADLYAGTGAGMAGNVVSDTPQSSVPSAEILVWNGKTAVAPVSRAPLGFFREPVSFVGPTRPTPTAPAVITPGGATRPRRMAWPNRRRSNGRTLFGR